MGKTLKLFLVDGTPNGILTAEIMNWTGHIMYAPRSRIADLIKRDEVKRTGVYILFGEDPSSPNRTLVYVGEGDSVVARLSIHNSDPEKEFWENVCVITSKDTNLTKAHARYLESRIIETIRDEGRAQLQNKTDPDFSLLLEADKSDMEEFLLQLQVLLPVLGVQFYQRTPKFNRQPSGEFRSVAQISASAETATQARQSFGQARPTADGGSSPEFHLDARDVRARAVEVDGQMVVLAGSEAREEELSSFPFSVKAYRDQLRQTGKLVPSERPHILAFREDVAFSSPSAAAQAIMGTSRNGRTDWKVGGTNRTYAQWQEAEVARAESESSLGFTAPQ